MCRHSLLYSLRTLEFLPPKFATGCDHFGSRKAKVRRLSAVLDLYCNPNAIVQQLDKTDSDIERAVQCMIDFGLRSDIVEHFVCLSTEHRTETTQSSEDDTGHLAREGVSEAIVRPEAYYLNRT